MSTAAAPLDAARTPPGLPPLVLAAVAVGVAFFLVEHNLVVSRLEMYGTTQEELEVNAAGGKLSHQVGFLLIGLLGVGLLIRREGRPWQVRGLLPLVIVLFAGWCLASTLWSTDPARTFKRAAILFLCLLGALGVGRALSLRELCRLALAVTASYAFVGLGTELVLGTWRPLGGEEYRFAGTLHPNGQGSNCALLCLSACCLLLDRPRAWPALVALILVGLGLLLLSGSRTSCAALVLGLVSLRLLRPSRALLAGALCLVLAACALGLGLVLAGKEPGALVDVVLLGRTEHAGTLTGRTELWQELLPYAGRRLLVGHGWGSFWSPQRIEEISETVYWDLSSAHSVYLEAVLGIGLVGAGTLALVVCAGLSRAGRLYRQAGGAGAAFAFALLIFGLVDGLAESGFLAPSLETFIAGCGLAQLGFFLSSQKARESEAPATDANARASASGSSSVPERETPAPHDQRS
jgi:exopolysaccharide production protein ExoQ